MRINSILVSFLVVVSVACGSSNKPQEPAKAPEVAGPVTASVAGAPSTTPVASGVQLKVGDKTRCPVSGEEFTVAENSPKVTHEGKDYYFCCPGCAERFKSDPTKYAK